MEPYKYTTPAEDLEVLLEYSGVVKLSGGDLLEDELNRDILFYFGEYGDGFYLLDGLIGNGDDFPDITEYLPCLSKEEFKGDKFVFVVQVLYLMLDGYKCASMFGSANIDWGNIISDKEMAEEMEKFEEDLCECLTGKLGKPKVNFEVFDEFERNVLKKCLKM